MASMTPGRKLRTGMDWRISSSGTMIISARRQAERIGHADSNQRVQRVKGQDAGILRNLRLGLDRAKPGTSDRVDAKNRRENK